MEKYDLSELRRLKEFLDRLLLLYSSLVLQFEAIGPARLRRHVNETAGWLSQYESPAADLLQVRMQLVATDSEFQQLVAQPSPEQLVDTMLKLVPDTIAAATGLPAEQIGTTLSYWQSSKNFLASLFIYGQPIHSLVQLGRRGNRSALLKALSIDPAVIGLKEISDQVAAARMAGDREFLDAVERAMRGSSIHSRLDHPVFKAVLCLTHDSGLLATLTQDERYELYCEQLGLYVPEKNDGRQGLNRFIDRWLKSLET